MLLPVNRLPPKTLSRIVQGIRDDSARDTLVIIPLTHVCRYWRESIISTRENWTIISNSQEDLAALCLERAKAAPLEIHFDMDGISGNSQFLDLLAPHFQHTETLRVTGLLTIEDLSLFSKYPMVNLRSLTLLNEGESDCDESIDPFASSAHALRYLKLVGVPLYPSFLNIRTLTQLDLYNHQCNLHLDTLLDFLEGNRSLTSVRLEIQFVENYLRSSRRRAPVKNQLQHLWIACYGAMDGQELISNIALSKGAELVFTCKGVYGPEVNHVLSGISMTHLSNLLSPTFIRYCVHPRIIELHGPSGAASFHSNSNSSIPFVEFPRLPLTNIRHFRLNTRWWELNEPSPGPMVFRCLSSFPTLETFTIEHETNLSRLLSALFLNPSASPSLKTLAFLDCVLVEEFMKKLMQFASDRKNTTSVSLRRVIINHRDGIFPSIASIRGLGKHVPIVDIRIAEELPIDL